MKYKSNSMLALISPCFEGEGILQQIRFFQETLRMRVFLFTILNPISFFSRFFNTRKAIEHKAEARNHFKHFVEKAFGSEIPDDYILRLHTGNKVSTLVDESKKGGYEFIVIDKSKDNYPGALHKNEIDKFISRSFCPVLTINRNYPVARIQKIVIPIDISQTTKKRLYWATHFAKKYNAEVQIVSALNADIVETKSLAFSNAEKIKNMLTGRGVNCEIVILKVHQQESYKVILNYIEEQKPDLVIIRTHQESIFTEARIGKFVSEIVHGCKMPVFAVGYTLHPQPVELES